MPSKDMHFFMCDFCKRSNFTEYRYKFLVCGDYDLCGICFESRNVDCQSHFQELKRQIDFHGVKLKEKIDEVSLWMIHKKEQLKSSYLKIVNANIEDSIKTAEKKTLEKDLKDLEEKVRNPKLLIKSMRQILSKEEIATIELKSKLNEMNHLKNRLIKTNELKQNFIFQ